MEASTESRRLFRHLNLPAYERDNEERKNRLREKRKVEGTIKKRKRGGGGKRGSGGATSKSKIRLWGDVLCYGDSLTFGLRHDSEDYPAGRHETPWPQLLKERLKPYLLRPIGSGVCSRTTYFDNPGQDDWCYEAKGRWFNGMKGLPFALLTHTPRWIVFLLGTNDTHPDVQKQYDEVRGHSHASPKQRAREIADNVARLAEFAQKFNPRKDSNTNLFEEAVGIVVVTPPPLVITEESREWGFDGTSVSISKEFPEQFAKMCASMGYVCAHPRQRDGVPRKTKEEEKQDKEDTEIATPPSRHEGKRTTRRKSNRVLESKRGTRSSCRRASEIQCWYCLQTFNLRRLKENGFRKTTRKPPAGISWACPECDRALDMSTSVDGVHFTEEHNAIVADAVWSALTKTAGRCKGSDRLSKRISNKSRPAGYGEA